MMRRAGKTIRGVAAAALCAGVLAGCADDGGGSAPSKSPGASDSPHPSASPSSMPTSATGKVTTSSGDLGRTFLVDARGRTLYLFEADTPSASTCSGGCAKAWPPVTVTRMPKAGGDARQGLLGTTTRKDGAQQVTYHGHPVYYYKKDSKPGDTKGQGLDQFGAKWFVVTPAGDALRQRSSPSPSSSSGGNGY
jgi:predicted lipoprotein with Yx(FWY)xxD motif